MSFHGSRGQATIEKTEQGKYKLTAEVAFDDDRKAQKLALHVAHQSLAPSTLAGWEMNAEKIREIDAQIKQAEREGDDELAHSLREALLDAAMREIRDGHPFARDVAEAVIHIVDEQYNQPSLSHRRSA